MKNLLLQKLMMSYMAIDDEGTYRYMGLDQPL